MKMRDDRNPAVLARKRMPEAVSATFSSYDNVNNDFH
jgi:hypothetical protein